ncbi:hypothetical protein XF35_38775 [Streptomyces platensis subsp. clarensis]|nr:hypothetical protein [Streptomyces platensis subsp. clarensis]
MPCRRNRQGSAGKVDQAAEVELDEAAGFESEEDEDEDAGVDDEDDEVEDDDEEDFDEAGELLDDAPRLSFR